MERSENFRNEAPKEERDLHAELGTYKERLYDAQIEFADHLCRRPGETRSFADILVDTTFILSDLEGVLKEKYSAEEARAAMQKVKDEINEAWAGDGENEQSKVADVISEESKELENESSGDTAETSAQYGEGVEKVGPLLIKRTKMSGLEKQGIGPNDEIIEAHLEVLFLSPETNLGAGTAHKLLADLATYLQDHPEIKAVVGKSWLLDHPIGKRIGFIEVPEAQMPGMSPTEDKVSAWSQFMTKDGTFNEKRFQEALARGALPFKSVFGYIPAAEFIKRYSAAEQAK